MVQLYSNPDEELPICFIREIWFSYIHALVGSCFKTELMSYFFWGDLAQLAGAVEYTDYISAEG